MLSNDLFAWDCKKPNYRYKELNMLSNGLFDIFCYFFADYKTYLFNINITHHE